MSVLRGEAALRVFARQRYRHRHDAVRATAEADERRLGVARLNRSRSEGHPSPRASSGRHPGVK